VQPLDVYPVQNENLKDGPGWAGINKPIKTSDTPDGNGKVYVAKNNSRGAFASLYPGHQARNDNIDEILASHIVADEWGMQSLTFQEGRYHARDGSVNDCILSPFRTDFKTLEETSVKSIDKSNADAAVALTILQGTLGDWDSTFNDSNVWVRSNHTAMGSDYGYAVKPGIVCHGIPFANLNIMRKFATKHNVIAITDRIKAQTDQQIYEMVDRVGQQWISGWTPELAKQKADILIHNRDLLRQKNPFLNYVQGFHPLLQHAPRGLLKALKYPSFFYSASGAKWPKENYQRLDVLISVSKYFRFKRVEAALISIRKHVKSPEEKAASAKP
jgi:hypothetical protein